VSGAGSEKGPARYDGKKRSQGKGAAAKRKGLRHRRKETIPKSFFGSKKRKTKDVGEKRREKEKTKHNG